MRCHALIVCFVCVVSSRLLAPTKQTHSQKIAKNLRLDSQILVDLLEQVLTTYYKTTEPAFHYIF